METNRKQSIKYSTALVFIGFLSTSSVFLFKVIPPSIANNVPQYFWMSTLLIALFLYLAGYASYFFMKGCSFLLQICQYLVIPLCSFCVVQIVQNYKNKSTQENLKEIIKAYVLLGVVTLLTAIKIISLNQTFPGESEKQILQFQIPARIFRLIKLCINCLAIIVLSESELQIITIVLNLLDVLIILKWITFIKLELEQVLIFASINNICSIFVYELVITDFHIEYILSQLILISIFFLFSNPFHFVIEFKLVLTFQELKIGRNHFQKNQSKSIIVLLLSCYSSIFQFHQKRLIVKKSAKDRWSTIFIQKLKNTYQIILRFYLNQLSYIACNNQQMIDKSKSISQIQAEIQDLFIQIYEEKKKNIEVVEDTNLFFNFISFCIDNFQAKQSKNLSWGYHNEFFLVFVPKVNPNFLMKISLYFYQRLSLTDQSLASSVRNLKIQHYLTFYKQSFMMEQGPQQKYMRFQYKLTEFKRKLQQICQQQIKIVQQFGNTVASLNFQILLKKRQNGKQKIFTLIDECFQFGQYLHFEQFAYLYLMFTVIFCKSIYQTSNQIRDKFITLDRKSQFSQNNRTQTSIVVCCGLEQENSKFGQILIANSYFRKQFGISNSEIEQKQRRVSDLIVGNAQKAKHLDLMLESSNFLEHVAKKTTHSDHKCLLKKNLQNSNANILGQFHVQTSIFHSHYENLLYLCKIEPISPYSYILKTQALGTNKRRGTYNEFQNVTHEQLGQKMQIRILDSTEIQSQSLARGTNSINSLDSLELFHSCQDQRNILDSHQKKFNKIQEVLWKMHSYGDQKLLKNIFLTFLFFVLICLTSISLYVFSGSISHRSQQIDTQIKNIIVKNQIVPLQVSLYLTIKKQIDTDVIAADFCPSFFPNLSTVIIEKARFWTTFQINEYFSQYQNDQIKIFPILDSSFWSVLSSDHAQYSSYLYTTSSITAEYLTTNLSSLNPEQRKQLNSFINTKSTQGQDSLSNGLLNLITNLGLKELNDCLIKTKIFFVCSIIIIAISIVLLFFFLFRTYTEYLQYFQLLFKTGEQFLYKRAHEMKFIIKQIQFIRDFNGTRCQFLSSFEISFQTPRGNKKQQYILNLNQFEKLVEPDEGKMMFEVSKFESKNTLLAIILSKKCLILAFLLCSCLLMTIGILIGQSTSKILTNSIKFTQIMKQGEKTRESYLYMIFANWIGLAGDEQIIEKDKMNVNFRNANNYLQQKQLVDILISNLDENQLNMTLNQDICGLLVKNDLNQTTYQVCNKNVNNFSPLGISQLMTVTSKNQYVLWRKINQGSSDITDGNKLCEDMRNFIYYLQPSFIAIWKILRNSLNSGVNSAISIYFAILCSGTIIFLLLILRQLIKTYFNLTNIVKFEVFTLDTPEDLYRYREFRPYLNKMLYHEFQSSS